MKVPKNWSKFGTFPYIIWEKKKDLFYYLFDQKVERERDKERLEMKRRIEQMKKNAEEEQEETKKKLHEVRLLQYYV